MEQIVAVGQIVKMLNHQKAHLGRDTSMQLHDIYEPSGSESDCSSEHTKTTSVS